MPQCKGWGWGRSRVTPKPIATVGATVSWLGTRKARRRNGIAGPLGEGWIRCFGQEGKKCKQGFRRKRGLRSVRIKYLQWWKTSRRWFAQLRCKPGKSFVSRPFTIHEPSWRLLALSTRRQHWHRRPPRRRRIMTHRRGRWDRSLRNDAARAHGNCCRPVQTNVLSPVWGDRTALCGKYQYM